MSGFCITFYLTFWKVFSGNYLYRLFKHCGLRGMAHLQVIEGRARAGAIF